MFISSAYAQGAGGGGSGLEAMLPLVLIFVVFYFLLIRPQQKKMKDHKQMLGNIRRGDIVITGGGITGKVTKVDNEHEVTVEIAKDVRVKVQRSLISGVQTKGEPVKGGAANENSNQKSGGGVLGKLFGMGGSQQQPTVKNDITPEPSNESDSTTELEAAEERAATDGDANESGSDEDGKKK